jgi:hypothetical protein
MYFCGVILVGDFLHVPETSMFSLLRILMEIHIGLTRLIKILSVFKECKYKIKHLS